MVRGFAEQKKTHGLVRSFGEKVVSPYLYKAYMLYVGQGWLNEHDNHQFILFTNKITLPSSYSLPSQR